MGFAQSVPAGSYQKSCNDIRYDRISLTAKCKGLSGNIYYPTQMSHRLNAYERTWVDCQNLRSFCRNRSEHTVATTLPKIGVLRPCDAGAQGGTLCMRPRGEAWRGRQPCV
jgi:hypothetical protein